MQAWGLTDPGCVRVQNQDAYGVHTFEEDSLLCTVCDGMGGAKSGNVASSLALQIFMQEVTRLRKPGMSQEQAGQMFREAVRLANFTVYDQSRQFEDFEGMGTTLVAAYVDHQMAVIANVGDSRCYLLNREGVRCLTTDHSLVQLMVQRGELSREQAKNYPGKNLITRAIGTEPGVECDLFYQPVQKGDYLLLCTDGLSNLLDDQEILFEVVHGVNKQLCCQRLLGICQERGAPDNDLSLQRDKERERSSLLWINT